MRRRRRITVIDNVQHKVDSVKTWFNNREQDAEDGLVHNLDTIGTLPYSEGEFKYSVVSPQSLIRRRKRPRQNDYGNRGVPKRLNFGTGQMRIHKSTARATKFRNNIGERKKKVTRRFLQKIPTVVSEDKVLSLQRCIEIPFNANEKVINARNDVLVNVKSIRIRRWFFLNLLVGGARDAQPISVRWAVINPKENNGGPGVTTSQFFRGRNPTTTPYVAFPTGNADCFDLLSSKINTEEFGVLKEGKFEMEINPEAFRNSGKQTKMIDIHIPLGRQLEFGSNTAPADKFPEENMYFVWWYCATVDPGTAKLFGGANAILSSFGENQVFFTNSRLYN